MSTKAEPPALAAERTWVGTATANVAAEVQLARLVVPSSEGDADEAEGVRTKVGMGGR